MSKIAPKRLTQTIQLSDTVDQWSRRVHINVRGGKTTLVHRWKSRKDGRDHTQRVTLNEHQAGRIVGALTLAVAKIAEAKGKHIEDNFCAAVGRQVEDTAPNFE
ncbi:hypothetical protein phiPccP1_00023 [Pectobacterium phage phiPccP-1]|nr:hypothetical protein phiPccP1_00023 [Pectobacterium phage phiPccP-1]